MKNDDYLQKYVKAEFQTDLVLILDVKTRWNSLLTMLEWFYKLRDCVRKALVDLNVDIYFSDSDIDLLLTTINALKPVKLAVDALCRRDANLLTADTTFVFMLHNLKKQGSELSTQLQNSLLERILQRRTNLSQVFQYLHDATSEGNEYFSSLSKNCILKTISNLVKRLVPEEANILQLAIPILAFQKLKNRCRKI